MNINQSSVSSPVQCSSLVQVNSLVLSTSRVSPFAQPPTNVSSHPFQIKFLTPSIKVCAGCKKGYGRAADGKSCLPPPNNLCLVRKEQHLYYNIVYGKQQLSSLCNVHYHINSECPRLRQPNFTPGSIEVPVEIKSRLLPEHWLFLVQKFGIS